MTGSISKTILSVVALIVGIRTNVFSQNEDVRFELIPGELSRRSIRAAKYSESDLVNLKIEAINKNIILEVVDFGKGFDLKNSTKGNGLVNLRSRAEKMGG